MVFTAVTEGEKNIYRLLRKLHDPSKVPNNK